MRIHVSSGSKLKRPAVGDTKIIKGVLYQRRLKRVEFGPHKGAHVVNSKGQFTFEWVPVEGTQNE